MGWFGPSTKGKSRPTQNPETTRADSSRKREQSAPPAEPGQPSIINIYGAEKVIFVAAPERELEEKNRKANEKENKIAEKDKKEQDKRAKENDENNEREVVEKKTMEKEEAKKKAEEDKRKEQERKAKDEYERKKREAEEKEKAEEDKRKEQRQIEAKKLPTGNQPRKATVHKWEPLK